MQIYASASTLLSARFSAPATRFTWRGGHCPTALLLSGVN
ncbi:hypothetical protein F385_1090 [Pantoea agglomerans 299R]|nr:hypothetical protein F385_1090 [Pantoea agglomerans 299R]